MSDDDNRRQEEWERYKRIRDLNTEGPSASMESSYPGPRSPYVEQTDLESPEVKCLGRSRKPRIPRPPRGPSISTIYNPRLPKYRLEPPLSEPFNINYPSETQEPTPSNLRHQLSDLNVSDLIERPRHMPRARPSIPYYAQQKPIPDYPIVTQYRDPVTGSPSMDRFREERPWAGVGRPETSSEMGSSLANLSRHQIEGMVSYDHGRQARKQKFLQSRGFERVGERYVPKGQTVRRSLFGRPPLRAQSEREEADLYMPRFNRPLREQDRKEWIPRKSFSTEGILEPVGRQRWGPQPMRRAMSLPDFSDPKLVADMDEPSRTDHFEKRYGALPSPDRESFKQFRDQVSLASNPLARKRMVKPPTYGNINEADKKRLSEMKRRGSKLLGYRVSPESSYRLRKKRRDYVKERAYQDFSFQQPRRPTETAPYTEWMAQQVRRPIPERTRRLQEPE